jgi:hypothetical protein
MGYIFGIWTKLINLQIGCILILLNQQIGDLKMDNELELTKLEKYFRKEGRYTLVEELRRLSREELGTRLQGQAKHLQDIIDTKAKDEKLKAAKEDVREYSETYNRQKRMCDKISRLIHLIVQEQGGA